MSPLSINAPWTKAAEGATRWIRFPRQAANPLAPSRLTRQRPFLSHWEAFNRGCASPETMPAATAVYLTAYSIPRTEGDKMLVPASPITSLRAGNSTHCTSLAPVGSFLVGTAFRGARGKLRPTTPLIGDRRFTRIKYGHTVTTAGAVQYLDTVFDGLSHSCYRFA